MRQIPAATYRLQLHSAFTFEHVIGALDYLQALGVSHVYLSPVLKAAAGSAHGYDVVDHSEVSAELGGEAGRRRLCEELAARGMSQILDIVPNHMAINSRANRWWQDVLENGPSSRYARFFDIEWQSGEERHADKVLAPILEDHYGRVLEDRKILVQHERGRFRAVYFDQEMPLAPRSVALLLDEAVKRCGSEVLAFLSDSFARLPQPHPEEPEAIQRRDRDKRILYAQLTRLAEEEPDVDAALDQAAELVNHDADLLDGLLRRQNYRLAYWKTAERQLGYRRFFDINTLVALRAEDPQVFQQTHRLILDWLAECSLDGVRIDHPDGLRDPAAYFRRLREAAPDAWIVVEKILAPEEELPRNWPVDGTTGYDFLFFLGGLFVDQTALEPLDGFYRQFTGDRLPFAKTELRKKRLAVRDLLGSDARRLVALLARICDARRRHRDYLEDDLEAALAAFVAALPIYRTYVQAETGELSDRDKSYIEGAVDRAKGLRPEVDPELFELLGDILLLRARGDLETEFVMRLQQFTGPVTAKGVEDTAFYSYSRLLSLNEVGGDPSRFGVSTDEFHSYCADRQRKWPLTMLATSTHDTKRSEDARCRISTISEAPDAWREAVEQWSALNQKRRREDLPDRKTEYFFYQSAIAVWPLEPERGVAYMLKAVREAKEHTSWTAPDAEYEEALKSFVDGALRDPEFQAAVERFVDPLLEPARASALSQTLLKLAAPGAPDIYQGCELWNLALVDPDNRRPVDFDERRRLLDELGRLTPEQIAQRSAEGVTKLWVTRQALALRRERPEAFGPRSTYEPLTATGDRAEHVVAFSRGPGVAAVATRLPLKLGGHWGDTTLRLPPGPWRDRLTDRLVSEPEVRLSNLLELFPVALLANEPAE